MENNVSVKIKAILENVSFARLVVSGFLLECNLLVNTVNEIKTIVSEAITNSIYHGYNLDSNNYVTLNLDLKDNHLTIEVIDDGVGIDDIELAKTPLYSSKPTEERSGLGFTIMEMFSDEVIVTSKEENGRGTKVVCKKVLDLG